MRNREYIYKFDFEVEGNPPQALFKRWRLTMQQAHSRMWRMLSKEYGDKLVWLECQRRPVG